jgi:SAM-dependent methyltransferase
MSGAHAKEKVMNDGSAYLLSKVDVAGQEVRRLSAQARLFLDLELPLLLSRLPEKALVADFGCGSGDIAVALAGARPQGEIWGLDADPLALAQGQGNQASPANLHFGAFAMGQGQALPVTGLDLAFTRLVLLHVPDPVAALKDMASALGPQGQVYVVETDDSLMRFEPEEAWQPRLLGLLEAVQASRGGSRRRGAEMGTLMVAASLRPDALGTVWYRKRSIGEASFAELFLPVTAFYLQEAARQGLAGADECDSLLFKAKIFVESPETEVAMALLHWSGTRA